MALKSKTNKTIPRVIYDKKWIGSLQWLWFESEIDGCYDVEIIHDFSLMIARVANCTLYLSGLSIGME